MRWASLRIRIGLWYALFTMSCLSLFGIFLSFYLGNALEASRAPTMVRRAARAEAFVNAEHHAAPQRPVPELLQAFLKASPESDELIVRSADNRQLVFAGGGQPLLQIPLGCSLPCFREIFVNGHNYRIYSVRAVLAGTPVLLTLSGSIDEHYGILRTVRTSYLLFVPFLLIASITGGYLLSRRSLLPVGRITAIASKLSISDLQRRVPVPDTGDELQNLAEAWNDMLARLQVSVERNAQFTSDASHDLRTSIAVMLASTQLALRRPRTPEQYAATLHTLASECQHTLQILEDLLASARSGFEQHELHRESIDFARMVRERCSLFAAEAESKSQALTVDVEPEAWISGDRSLLHRLIGVLVENAIKYTPPGGSVAVSLRSTPALLLLRVQDTGPGIAPDDLSRVFSRAFRAESSRGLEQGSGLGLSIARWIAEAHHATLEVRSHPGLGCTFEVAFPHHV